MAESGVPTFFMTNLVEIDEFNKCDNQILAITELHNRTHSRALRTSSHVVYNEQARDSTNDKAKRLQ